MKVRPTRNEHGSALLIAIAATAVLALVATAGLSISNQLRSQSAAQRPKLSSSRLASYAMTLLGDPQICAGAAGTPFSGLAFVSGSGGPAAQNLFNPAQPKQQIQIGSNLAQGALMAGAPVDEFGVKISNFYLDQVAGGGSAYTADVYLQTVDLVSQTNLSPQLLGTIHMNFASGTLSACSLKMQAADVCSSMGCSWNATSTPKCACHFPQLDCTDTAAGDPPYGYVQGYTMVAGSAQKICKSADFSCPGGQFLQGFSASGGMICLTPPTPTPTPTPLPTATPAPTATPSTPAPTATPASTPTPSPTPSAYTWHMIYTYTFFPKPQHNCVTDHTTVTNGDACSNAGEICTWVCDTSVNPFCAGGATNTVSAGPSMGFEMYCARAPLNAGDSVAAPVYNCPAANSATIIVPTTPYDTGDSCATGAAQCTGPGTMLCLPQQPDGTIITTGFDTGQLPLFCIGPAPQAVPACTSGVATCTAANAFQCTASKPAGYSYSDPSSCSGTVWQPVPSLPSADAVCTSGQSHCSAVSTKTCD